MVIGSVASNVGHKCVVMSVFMERENGRRHGYEYHKVSQILETLDCFAPCWRLPRRWPLARARGPRCFGGPGRGGDCRTVQCDVLEGSETFWKDREEAHVIRNANKYAATNPRPIPLQRFCTCNMSTSIAKHPSESSALNITPLLNADLMKLKQEDGKVCRHLFWCFSHVRHVLTDS